MSPITQGQSHRDSARTTLLIGSSWGSMIPNPKCKACSGCQMFMFTLTTLSEIGRVRSIIPTFQNRTLG